MKSVNLAALLLAASASLSLHAQLADPARLTNQGTPQPENPIKDRATKSDADKEAELSLDELRDMGPLHALAKAPPHQWFEAGAGVQAYYTDNAALSEDKTWSDVETLSANVGVNSKPMKVGNGKLSFNADYSYAATFYGNLSDRANHSASGTTFKLDQLDFQSHSANIDASWKGKTGWNATTGLRYSAYFNTDSGNRDYSEWSPYMRGGKQFQLTDADYLGVFADTDYRFSDSPTQGTPVAKNRMDRFDAGLTFAYTRLIAGNWFVQPSYRVSYAYYTQSDSTVDEGAGRQDVTHTVTLTAGYAPTNWLIARVYTSWEARESNESWVADYRATNIGLGASVSAKF
jgi:hypothetical protein